ncbi:MAG: GNAT family N-acetyltransferase [Chloroflexota bacterium]
MTVIIRRATIEDVQLLTYLNRVVHEPHVKHHPNQYKPFIPNNPELIEIYKNRINDETCFTFIAQDNDRGVGYVQCFVQEKREHAFGYGKIDCYIDQIAVLETHQSYGLFGIKGLY